MLLIPCPHCGPCAQIEFTYGGDASVTRPEDPTLVDDAAWHAYLYLRDNPHDVHDEWWHHGAGCRSWIRVRRDVATHAFIPALQTARTP